jgi:phosphohistidine phosphatase
MARLCNLLGEYRSAERVMLVGHEPDFSSLIGELTGGSRVQLKKGGLARVDLETIDHGAGTLVWLLPPLALRQAG